MTTSPGYSLIASRGDFHAALRAAFAEAASVGCRDIWICDTDFADWPLNEVAVVESLTQWAQSHRKLTVLAQTFDEVARRHGRWIEWRRLWNHVVECRANVELEAGEMPTMMLAPGLLTLRLVDPVRYRGSVSHQAADAIAAKELFDAVLQRSAEAFPVTTLGL